MANENGDEQKFFLDRAGKRVQVDLEHLRKPHSLKPRIPPAQPSSPLVIGGDHRPSANPGSKDAQDEPEKTKK